MQDHFLTRFREAYLAEVIDFVDTMLSDRAPLVTGEDGLRAVEIAVAAEKSYQISGSVRRGKACITALLGLLIRPVSASNLSTIGALGAAIFRRQHGFAMVE